jgi:hypothetical protein
VEIVTYVYDSGSELIYCPPEFGLNCFRWRLDDVKSEASASTAFSLYLARSASISKNFRLRAADIGD